MRAAPACIRFPSLGQPGTAKLTEHVTSHLSLIELYIQNRHDGCTREETPVAITTISIRLDTKLADEAVRILGVKSRTQAVHVALREIVALRRFKTLMKKQAGKLRFDAHTE
jgi:Arc/MetJ family transcription regulator